MSYKGRIGRIPRETQFVLRFDFGSDASFDEAALIGSAVVGYNSDLSFDMDLSLGTATLTLV